MKRLAIPLLMMLTFTVAQAESALQRLHGTWISPDGHMRQKFEPGFDADWLSTGMWFREDDHWKLVAIGAIYREPGGEFWNSISRVRDMEGYDLIVAELRPDGEIIRVRNRAYRPDGSMDESEGVWRFPAPDRFDYSIQNRTDQGVEPAYEGYWLKQTDPP